MPYYGYRRLKSTDVEQLFWSIVNPLLGDDRCWEWPYSKTSTGYASFHYRMPGGKVVRKGNRIAFYLAYGYLPGTREICHTCNNKPCCRPSHLYAGSHAQNMQDAERDGLISHHAKAGQWGSPWADACIDCHTTTLPRKQHNRCAPCYFRWYAETHREQRRTYHREWRHARKTTQPQT